MPQEDTSQKRIFETKKKQFFIETSLKIVLESILITFFATSIIAIEDMLIKMTSSINLIVVTPEYSQILFLVLMVPLGFSALTLLKDVSQLITFKSDSLKGEASVDKRKG